MTCVYDDVTYAYDDVTYVSSNRWSLRVFPDASMRWDGPSLMLAAGKAGGCLRGRVLFLLGAPMKSAVRATGTFCREHVLLMCSYGLPRV